MDLLDVAKASPHSRTASCQDFNSLQLYADGVDMYSTQDREKQSLKQCRIGNRGKRFGFCCDGGNLSAFASLSASRVKRSEGVGEYRLLKDRFRDQ